MNTVDLHIHTTASDGTLTPAEVVRYSKEKGLLAIAITDHDTIEGLKDALDEGSKLALEVIPGVELSVECPHGSMHLLGYYIESESKELAKSLHILQQARKERNEKMVAKLRDLGIMIDLKEMKRGTEDGQIGRLHFAYTLVKKGYAQNIQDAFDKYLYKGGPAYVEKYKYSAQDAIKLIHQAKGIAVLAHPFTLNKLARDKLTCYIGSLSELGLDGIEVYYPEHSKEQMELYLDIAEKYKLVVTGGSDFHGLTKEGVDIGKGYGCNVITYAMVEKIKARRKICSKEDSK